MASSILRRHHAGATSCGSARSARASSLAGYLRLAARGRGQPGQGEVGHLRLPRRRADAHGHVRPEAGRAGRVPRRVQADRDQRRRASRSASTCRSWRRCADKFAILRGVSHTLAGHELGTEYLNTGSRPVPSLVYPGYGAVVSKELAGDRRPAALRGHPEHAAEGRLPRRPLRPAADQRRRRPPGMPFTRPRHLARQTA